MPKVMIRGPVAEVRWGYHCAVSLGPWSIEDDRLTAAVTSMDAFKASQKPLTLVIARPKRDWVWSVETLHINDNQVTATLGPVKE